MKKGRYLLFLLVILIFTKCPDVFAEKKADYASYEAYGLCVVSKVLDYNENFNMDSFIDLETYDKIINFWFGAKTVANSNPTNADAIYDISRFAPEVKDSKYKITHFKDFGFITKKHRYAYRVMCRAGFLDFESQFLHPNYRLSYKTLFKLLMHFESYAKSLHGYELNEGVITDALSEKNNIIIVQSTPDGEKRYEFSRMHSFYVHQKDSIMPYSYNLKRGMKAKIFTLNDEIIFASIPSFESELKDNYKVFQARMFLCNNFDREIIFKNNTSDSYMVYKYDSETFVFEGMDKKTIDDINITLIDRHCFFIIDEKKNLIKYINVTG